jgi:hypothetical protein
VACSKDTLNIEYAGAFRNDTIERKVFYIPPMPPITYLLYDFSLVVGDTVPDSFQNLLYPLLTVKKIDTVNVNEEPRKRFTFWAGPDPSGVQFFVYEGIGSDIGLLEEYEFAENQYYLKCFHNNDTLEYIHPGDTTCNLESDTCLINALGDIPSKGNSYFNISLSSDQIIIRREFSIDDLSLSVYNLQGALVYRLEMNSDIIYVSKDVFHPGFYIFILKTDNMILDRKKVFINQ